MHRRSNPVLDADWPDPDAIRVGSDVWMIASSFNRAPGLPVLRSRDLVDWEHVTNALPALPQTAHYAVPRRGSGVWAPSIREHEGRFHIVYPDPDHGIFVVSADYPAGPWEEPHLLLAGRGLIDPCPLWDEDGGAYLVHGWARSRARVKNRLTLLEVTPDLRAPLDGGEIIIDGDDLGDMLTLEGPKIYRMHGAYWIWAPAGGVADGYQVVFRADDLRGPWEHRIVLEQGSTPVNGPHQGALIDDEDGAWWFLHFQDRGVFGRVVHAQPVRFGEDGWPRVGAPIDDLRGQPVAVVPAFPASAGAAASQADASQADAAAATGADAAAASDGYHEPQRSDDFSSPVLHPRWHWQANPRPEWIDLPGDGALRLGFASCTRGDLRDLGAILGQQIPGKPSRWTTMLSLENPAAPAAPADSAPDASGETAASAASAVPAGRPARVERAGVTVLGYAYAWAGLRRTGDTVALVSGTMGADDADEQLTVHRLLAPAEAGSAGAGSSDSSGSSNAAAGAVSVELAVEIDAEGRATLSADGQTLLAGWQATEGHWIGAEIGLFAATDGQLGSPVDERRARFGPLVVRREGEPA
ncbi:family 43 glycosylhydrolase [Brachybacterium sp. DNPG3]